MRNLISDGRRAIKEALAKTGADTQSVRESIDDMEGYLLAVVPLPAEPSQLELSHFRCVLGRASAYRASV